MTKNVSELNIPTIHPHFLISDTKEPYKIRQNQIDELIELSKNNWIVKSSIGYYIFNNSDVSSILKDKRWHSGVYALQTLFSGSNPENAIKRVNTLSAMDGEEHSLIRKLIAPAFTHAFAKAQKDFAYKYAKELLNIIIENNLTDFAEFFCKKYPIIVLCHTIGLPKEDWEKFIDWTQILSSHIIGTEQYSLDQIRRAESEISKYVYRLALERRKEPKDDFITKLVMSEHEGEILSDRQLALTIGTMINGGVETLIAQLGMVIIYLCQNPELFNTLKHNKDFIPDAVLEITRLTSSIRGSIRIASEDIEYNGVLFPKGTFVFLSLSASNRDRNIYNNPDEFQFGRNHSQDLSFGAGMHYCPGANLAKIEMAEVLSAFVDLFDTMTIKDVEYRPSNSAIFAPTILNIEYTTSKGEQ